MAYVYTLGPGVSAHRQLPIYFNDTFTNMAPGMIGTQRPTMTKNHLLHRPSLGRKKQIPTVAGINEMRFSNIEGPSRTNMNDILMHHPFDYKIYRKKEPPPDFIKLNRLKMIASSFANSESSKPFKQNRENKHLKFRKMGQSKNSDRIQHGRKDEEESMYLMIGQDYHRKWFERAVEKNKEWHQEYTRQRQVYRGEQKGIILRTRVDNPPPKSRVPCRRWTNVKSRINTFRT